MKVHFHINELVNEFGISRSTLLHYETLGLLKPMRNGQSNYRVYSENDKEVLKKIKLLRSGGLSLHAIKELLIHDRSSRGKSETTTILEQRLETIARDISELRNQQKVLYQLLQSTSEKTPGKKMTKALWTKMLADSGLSDDAMMHWHHQFETQSPEAHQEFLESLHLDRSEIRQIRQRSRNYIKKGN